jgi:hypothetical protein
MYLIPNTDYKGTGIFFFLLVAHVIIFFKQFRKLCAQWYPKQEHENLKGIIDIVFLKWLVAVTFSHLMYKNCPFSIKLRHVIN